MTPVSTITTPVPMLPSGLVSFSASSTSGMPRTCTTDGRIRS
jgi:hypothetical protein